MVGGVSVSILMVGVGLAIDGRRMLCLGIFDLVRINGMMIFLDMNFIVLILIITLFYQPKYIINKLKSAITLLKPREPRLCEQSAAPSCLT